MKFSEMNEHQKLATMIVYDTMCFVIGGVENDMQDYPEGSEEYEDAKAYLTQDREALIDDIYYTVMSRTGEGSNKHLRFAGEAFIRERISNRLTKWGY